MNDTVSPAVITSNTATNHLNTTVKPEVTALNQGMQDQSAAKAQVAATNTTNATTAAPTAASTTPAQPLTSATYTGSLPTTTPSTSTTTPYTPPSPDSYTSELNTQQTNLADEQARYDTQAQNVATQINQISSGIIPLNAGQKAQVDGLTQQYSDLIKNQQLTNISASGIANIRGYQKGAAEYDPTFVANTIGTIVAKGNQLVADLNTKMAAAVGQLTESFKQGNIANVKEQWNILKDVSERRQAAIQKTIDDTQKAIKDAQDAQAEQIKNINSIAIQAAKNGAPANVVNAINASGSTSQAISAAGQFMQEASGEMGEYLFYRNETLSRGLTPNDFSSWQAQKAARESKQKANEAYNNAYASAAGKAAAEAATSGSSGGGSFASTVNQATDFEPAKTQATYRKELQDLINKGDYKGALLKIQNSVSKALTGENKTQFDAKVATLPAIDALSTKLQAYADAGGNTGILKGNVESIMNKLGNVSDPKFKALATDLKIALQKYRHDMSGAAFSEQESRDYASVNPSGNNTITLNQAILSGMKDNFQREVDSTIESKVGEGAKNIKDYANAKQLVNEYSASHPDQATTIANLYNVAGTTDADVLQYISMMNNQ